MNRERFTAIALAAVLVSGCSSTPRHFVPQLAAPPADEAEYRLSLKNCQYEAAQLGRKGSGRLGSAGAGLAGGAGAAAIGSAATSGTYSSFGAAAAAGGAVIVAVPFVGLATAWGIARANRAKKERRINEAASQCLSDEGYTVASWKRVKRPRKVENGQATPEATVLVAN